MSDRDSPEAARDCGTPESEEQRSAFNVRALTITPNTFFRQDVQYSVRKRHQEPNHHPPVGFMACDPKVVV